jgi:hypothetical protein
MLPPRRQVRHHARREIFSLSKLGHHVFLTRRIAVGIVGAQNKRILADQLGDTVDILVRFAGDENPTGREVLDRVFGFSPSNVVPSHLSNQVRHPTAAGFQEGKSEIRNVLEGGRR